MYTRTGVIEGRAVIAVDGKTMHDPHVSLATVTKFPARRPQRAIELPTCTPPQGLGKVFHSSCWLGDLSGLGDELEWSQRVSGVVSEGCGDADSSGQAMEADRGVA